MSDQDLLILLTVILSAVVVVVLAAALIIVRRKLERISGDLATLASALQGVESEHLRPLDRVTDMTWDDNPQKRDYNPKSDTARKRKVNPPTHCSGCHR